MSGTKITRSRQTMWEFAGLIADGMSPSEAGVALGKSASYGRVLMQRLIQRMGPPAV